METQYVSTVRRLPATSRLLASMPRNSTCNIALSCIDRTSSTSVTSSSRSFPNYRMIAWRNGVETRRLKNLSLYLRSKNLFKSKQRNLRNLRCLRSVSNYRLRVMRTGFRKCSDVKFFMDHKFNWGIKILECICSMPKKRPRLIDDVKKSSLFLSRRPSVSHFSWINDITIAKRVSRWSTMTTSYCSIQNIIVTFTFRWIICRTKSKWQVRHQNIDHWVHSVV